MLNWIIFGQTAVLIASGSFSGTGLVHETAGVLDSAAWPFSLGASTDQLIVTNHTGTDVAAITLAGDATYASGSLTVTGLQGRAVQNAAPSSGYVLAWNSGASQWQPTAPTSIGAGTNGQALFTASGVSTWETLTGDVFGSTSQPGKLFVANITGPAGAGGTVGLSDATHDINFAMAGGVAATQPRLLLTGATGSSSNPGGDVLISTGLAGSGSVPGQFFLKMGNITKLVVDDGVTTGSTCTWTMQGGAEPLVWTMAQSTLNSAPSWTIQAAMGKNDTSGHDAGAFNVFGGQGGTATSLNSTGGNGGPVVHQGGQGGGSTGNGANSNGGNWSADGGSRGTGGGGAIGLHGQVNIGTGTTSAVTIGKSAITTTIPGTLAFTLATSILAPASSNAFINVTSATQILGARNAANTADINVVGTDSSNNVIIGGGHEAGVNIGRAAAGTTIFNSVTTPAVNQLLFPGSTAGFINTTNATEIVASRNAGNTADIYVLGTDGSNNVLLGGVNAGGVIIDSPSSITLGSSANTINFGASITSLTWPAGLSSNVTMLFTQPAGDTVNGANFVVKAQSAHSGATVNPNGGNIVLGTGDAGTNGSVGLRGALNIGLGNTPNTCAMINVCEVVLGQRAVALVRCGTNVGATQLPANSGDGVVYIANAQTQPTVNAVGGGLIWANSTNIKCGPGFGVVNANSLLFDVGISTSGVATFSNCTIAGGTAGLPLNVSTSSATTGTFTPNASSPLITLTGGALSGNLTVALANGAGTWVVDASGITLNAHSLIISSGTATITVTTLTAKACFLVTSRGSNTISALATVGCVYS